MLPKTFVGFSASDTAFYCQMLAWRGKEGIDFHFIDRRLDAELDPEDEEQIKGKLSQQIGTLENYALLIGEDTCHKNKLLDREAEVAIEKGCKIIGVNLDGARQIVERKCPAVIRNAGAVFVPFAPRIIAYALINFRRREQGNWHFPDEIYRQLESPI